MIIYWMDKNLSINYNNIVYNQAIRYNFIIFTLRVKIKKPITMITLLL